MSDGGSGTVRSLRFRGPGVVEPVTSVPAGLGAEDVRIAPSAVGVCGTDAHIVAGSFPAEVGVVLGHEVCGRVIERGSTVGDLPGAPEVGDLVTVEPHRYCTACRYCRAGQEHLCAGKRGYGVRLDGGMTDQMVVPARIAYRLPERTVPWVGAMCEPVSCAIHGMDRLRVVSGEALLIYGCGPAGAILVALARLLGANPVVVMEPNPARRDLAHSMGADLTFDAADPDADAEARAVTGGDGFAAVIDAVGSASVLERAVSMAARGGRVLEFGVAAPDDTAAVRPHELFSRELTLLGSVINPYTHQRAVSVLPRLGLERLTPAFFELSEFENALRGQREGVADKVFVAPRGVDVARGVTR
ncbi:threonine dehydrogenase-like Zn-dependent dehydrogenase [Haloactinopolyspora alba]|uniref:Threonine dehydrogenase-like Zn-dependent dehydrogenase n=1 Tax=Haloactinopolyspora alba TaxID=648780 RepID=A0A2P8E9B9_9ACTN|nr:alcohol dehydrogenase catalytic domain-containing protein [Haloactinopolyspora alba]PSL06038.1 threonine dehydrogenase-like Zn-dependent dehydrogenase [Haloactinopolyspora alba]